MTISTGFRCRCCDRVIAYVESSVVVLHVFAVLCEECWPHMTLVVMEECPFKSEIEQVYY